jgi:hypothetical protein
MGFEGILKYGAPGSSASTPLENAQDIKVDRDNETAETIVRGDSTEPPMATEQTVIRKLNIEFTMLVDTGDTAFEALMDAVANGTGVALRGLEHATGKGPDADFCISASQPFPLKGAQAVTFTAKASRSYGRAPKSRI